MNTKEIFVKMSLSAWETQNSRVKKLLDALTDEQLLNETAPARNRGVYLIGHLITVSDGMFPILGLGERLYPQLEEVFLKKPDKSGLEMPSISELRKQWDDVHNKLSAQFSKISADDWFSRHTAVSESDFAKEPHRNKLNILINRANHTSYHLGQLVYLSVK
jgi:hypothetical protein